MKYACVMCNGELSEPWCAESLCRKTDLLIAADGGIRHLASTGLRPHVVIGDGDSIPANRWGNGPDTEWIALDPEKDQTDAEAAVALAFTRGCDYVTLVAAVGGRLDHTLGNVALVAQYPGRVAISHDGCTLVGLTGGHEAHLDGPVGSRVSLFQWGDGDLCVYTRGLKYPLQGALLRCATHGISNLIAEQPASVRVRTGHLLLWAASGEPRMQEDTPGGREL